MAKIEDSYKDFIYNGKKYLTEENMLREMCKQLSFEEVKDKIEKILLYSSARMSPFRYKYNKETDKFNIVLDPNAKITDREIAPSTKYTKASATTLLASLLVAKKGIPNPMLCNSLPDDMLTTRPSGKKAQEKFDQFETVMCQRKLDGNYCMLVDGEFYTRAGKKVESVSPDKYLKNISKHRIYCGELYSSSIPFDQLSGIIRTKTPVNAEEYGIKFYIFDYVDNEASEIRQYNLAKLSPSGMSEIVETFFDVPRDKIVELHDMFVEEGYEGIIIRLYGKPYVGGRHEGYIYKWKQFDTSEGVIIDATDGVGLDEGCIIFKLKLPSGDIIDVKPKKTIEERRQMFKEKNKYLNKTYTYSHAKGEPKRFPVGLGVRDMDYN